MHQSISRKSMHDDRLAQKGMWQVQELVCVNSILELKLQHPSCKLAVTCFDTKHLQKRGEATSSKGCQLGTKQTYECTCAEIQAQMRMSCQFLTQLPTRLPLAQRETAWRQNVHLSAHAVHAEGLHGMEMLRSNGLTVSKMTSQPDDVSKHLLYSKREAGWKTNKH